MLLKHFQKIPRKTLKNIAKYMQYPDKTLATYNIKTLTAT